MIEIDGSHEEGGGQILRTALGLSVLTGKAFHITGIRKNRKNPGLKIQHYHIIHALKNLCDAETTKYDIGTEELTFNPGKINNCDISIDIGTAGSITLVLQALVIPCLFGGDIKIKIKGGTDVSWSPLMDYFKNVFVKNIERLGEIKTDIKKRGFYPKGNGEVIVEIKPKYSLDEIKREVIPFDLTEFETPKYIQGISFASEELAENKVAERQKKGALQILSGGNYAVKIDVEYNKTLSTGTGIVLYTCDHFVVGADNLGKKKVRAEIIGNKTAEKLMQLIKDGVIDEYLSDQLTPFMALLPKSKIKVKEITGHCKSNIYVCEKFLPIRFQIEKQHYDYIITSTSNI